MSEQIAQFRLNHFLINKSLIEITADIEGKVDVQFTQTSSRSEDDLHLKYMFGVKITTENEAVKIEVDAIGYFEFDKNLNDEEKNLFEKVNAPAILFPYVRAYITSLTALSGIMPITLPTLNLSQRQN